ncbi:HIT family protein [Methanimicrococcus blatticola]|uniref:Histidine triad (HIT) family protein n=1 Tax=Methanimicrococcus blatticola TaxID=91560 RepID=A0A484F738_9EURY|nr:HIT family protein [Methanimicrococcus blatticola]MBZ3935629.1 HIT family protein [Methanimicrococcus blatticola]MCC2509270.1 HIT family protein [Methanimicrococcus blatticola]TDQ69364.1 histidine triad (HIT) family protein [Methanimicrococcus blatticola]
MDCIFCKIIAGEIPCYKIYEDENALAFLDVGPCADGHTMVIPKKHSDALVEMAPEETGKLFEAVNKVSNQIMNKMDNITGLTIGANTYESAGQTVMHTHIHIFPRYEGDGGGTTHSIVDSATSKDPEQLKKMHEILTK